MNPEKRKMLIVDDEGINRLVLSELFNAQFDLLNAANGEEALELIKEHRESIAMVLLDLLMPVMDGFGVINGMIELELGDKIPVIMITSESDDEKILEGYTLGVSDIVSKPFNPDIVVRRVNNVIALYSHQQELEEKLAEQKIMLEQQSARLRMSTQFVIDALSTTVEFRSLESGQHIQNVRKLTGLFLEQLSKLGYDYGLSDEDAETISNVSVMHDIGKIAIPDAILQKPGKLTHEEFEIMKTHTIKGCEIIESVSFGQDKYTYRYCYDICRSHHERWDGRGYPDGLKGDDIPIWAQVTSLADVYDALTSPRVYKPAYAHDEAIDMILNGECGEFNPQLMEALKLLRHSLPDLIHML